MFNWFRRKFGNEATQEEEKQKQPTKSAQSDTQAKETKKEPETKTAQPSNDTSKEDYLNWAKAAYQNIQQRKAQEKDKAEITVTDKNEQKESTIEASTKTTELETKVESTAPVAITDTTSEIEEETKPKVESTTPVAITDTTSEIEEETKPKVESTAPVAITDTTSEIEEETKPKVESTTPVAIIDTTSEIEEETKPKVESTAPVAITDTTSEIEEETKPKVESTTPVAITDTTSEIEEETKPKVESTAPVAIIDTTPEIEEETKPKVESTTPVAITDTTSEIEEETKTKVESTTPVAITDTTSEIEEETKPKVESTAPVAITDTTPEIEEETKPKVESTAPVAITDTTPEIEEETKTKVESTAPVAITDTTSEIEEETKPKVESTAPVAIIDTTPEIEEETKPKVESTTPVAITDTTSEIEEETKTKVESTTPVAITDTTSEIEEETKPKVESTAPVAITDTTPEIEEETKPKVESTTPVAITDTTSEIEEETKTKVESTTPVAITDTTSETTDISSASASVPAWMRKSDGLERLKKTAIETPVQEEEQKQPTAEDDLAFDEEFVWSAQVLAAQGRKPEDISEEEINWLKRLRQGLGKTRRSLINQLKAIVGQGPLNEDAVMEIEALLLQADVGIEATDYIINTLQNQLRQESLPPEQAIAYLKTILRDVLDQPLQNVEDSAFIPEKDTLNIWLMTGVNGAGKTTTIGKLAHLAQKSGYSCLIAAADTFRAAAVEQVKVWGERSSTPVIANPGKNTDPAAVVFDGITAAQSRSTELLLVDTAGRLQNKKNLMEELTKIRRIIDKKAPDALVESLLVLDATLGQNGLRQAQVFSEAAKLSGVVLTKLDGTAKGGVALAVAQQLNLPIRFVGAGEGIEDLRPFSSYEFVEALLNG